jgi:hypothetical protein
VDSLTLVPFILHISLHLFHLVFCSWIKSQTFGTRLKWGWLSKIPLFDHFPVGSTSHLHNTILQNDSCTCEYYLKHISKPSRKKPSINAFFFCSDLLIIGFECNQIWFDSISHFLSSFDITTFSHSNFLSHPRRHCCPQLDVVVAWSRRRQLTSHEL